MQSRNEDILRATIDGTVYDKLAQSRVEFLLLELKDAIESGGGTPTETKPLTETQMNNLLSLLD